MSLDPDFAAVLRAWREDDPREATREELDALMARADQGDEDALRELEDAFSGPLQFGTAGLRGKMGPGPFRMNASVVSRAAAGIGAYLTEKVGSARVVIGYDARYNSRDYAHTSAAILAAAGHEVRVMPEPWPTPVLAFAVRDTDADCGIMVTASHNPAADNGYKVYLGGRAATEEGRGVQIVPPADADIAAQIAAVGPVREISLDDQGYALFDFEIRARYITAISEIASPLNPKDVRIVHTAMHGVGHETMMEAFADCSFSDVHSVREQAEPDPDFPTVAFPNPEEKGAIDLALKQAEAVGADLVIANDPDADRCAAAVFDPHLERWRMLHGDELGLLLAIAAVRRDGRRGVFANSIVSSRALGALAGAHGIPSAQTLTGFKWIARTPGLSFGYEEAIGYCVLPNVVRDKDGISAALAIAQLAADVKDEGSSLVGLLDDFAREKGLYATDQLSIRVDDLSRIAGMMERVRTRPPASLEGVPAYARDLKDGSLETTGLPPTDGMHLLSEVGTRVIIRPSGTEPKLKAYLEVIEMVEPGATFENLSEARRSARARLEDLKVEVKEVLGA